MNTQGETTISTLDEMCELMCGGVEEEFYDEFDMHEIYDEEEDN